MQKAALLLLGVALLAGCGSSGTAGDGGADAAHEAVSDATGDGGPDGMTDGVDASADGEADADDDAAADNDADADDDAGADGDADDDAGADGDADDDAGADTDAETPSCGDGRVDPGEECDDGNDTAGDGCEPDCTWSCETSTECDDAEDCNGVESCGTDHVCVDGTPPDDGTPCIAPGGEAGACRGGICVPAACGNGWLDAGEECDDANTDDTDDCLPTCRRATCGDGAVRAGHEQCDDGNDATGDGCEPDCTWTCEASTECDDGEACNGAEFCGIDHICAPGTPPDDATPCTTAAGEAGACRSGVCAPYGCGNGFVELDEECDDANTDNTDACLSDCRRAFCGDGFVRAGVENCDGESPLACTTSCDTTGTRACVDCLWEVACTPPAEVCNGRDDDCDGAADDGFDCTVGATASCTTTCGSVGSQRCSAACAWEACVPPAEVCNGRDDDCDGAADDGYPLLGAPCDGPDADLCANGFYTCTADGLGVECAAESVEGLVELCDAVDNDCDGTTNEGFEWLGTPCDGSDFDFCENGTYTCAAGGLYLECVNEVPAGLVELCDNVDNDCDTSTDNGIIRPCGVCGHGSQTCSAGVWSACAEPTPPASLELVGRIRDFRRDGSAFQHPDFEYTIADDRGIVETILGTDGKPVYARPTGTTPTTHGRTWFDMWYRDTADYNLGRDETIVLAWSAADGAYVFEDTTFFPIDGELFGNEGRAHNYHFTFELHTRFEYRGGEVFEFFGDDDLWVFINGHLVIDLGGVHGAERASVNLDAVAASIGITPCGVYTLDLFFAERHTVASQFRVETTMYLQPA